MPFRIPPDGVKLYTVPPKSLMALAQVMTNSATCPNVASCEESEAITKAPTVLASLPGKNFCHYLLRQSHTKLTRMYPY